uniref:splicing factor, suppressor of white-apricot homolog n=1 Tax=Monopterus albus TaxID=43700 RepID=UPI0009B463F6|nr:splicing factor, suppressor of white-apricot homolog [Monopterus albus]
MYRRGAAKKDHNNKPVKKDVSDSDKYADLLVFGYACKLFRDDERALYHEHGKHLIPWMGDKSFMIDRYDGRGHLHDLSEYDSGSWNTSYQLSEEEARIEALCDEERYLALHTDLLEEEARQEEEYKRLSEALADEGSYNAVGFKYTADYYDPSQPTEEEDANRESEEAEPEESEEPFVAPAGLVIPPDVELPATIKTHNIIERTAKFVSQQGAQFEIVLKAKQSGNSQFDFLRFDHYLNPYYKHILRAMKEGRYSLVSTNKEEPAQESQSDSDEDGDGNYLHPSLFAPKKSSRLEELMKPLKVMDPDHPLAVLVQKAQQERNGTAGMTPKPEEVTAPSVPSTPIQYSAEPIYYGYYMLPDGTYCMAPPPPGIDASSYYNSLPSAVIAPPPTSSGTLPHLGTTPAPAGTIAMAPPDTAPSQVTSSAVPESVPATSSKVEAQVSAPAAPAIVPPAPDIQPVIDKLAEYVARNGVKFEASVRAKNDPRFDFLQSWHQYNAYYEFKKNYYMQKEEKAFPESGTIDDDKLQSDKSDKDSKLTKASFAPICFAIKAKENDMLPLEKNRVRLDDDSDEDKLLEGDGLEAALGGAEIVNKEPPPAIAPEEKRPVLSLEELEAKQGLCMLQAHGVSGTGVKLQRDMGRRSLLFKKAARCSVHNPPPPAPPLAHAPFRSHALIVSLSGKLEDRLAAAAREKLAQASKESKEKQLQAERKRKAALFLQTLRSPFTGEPEAKRAELDSSAQLEMQEALSVLSDLPPSQAFSAPSAYLHDQRPTMENQGAYRSKEAPSSSSYYPNSRGSDRDKDRDRERGRDRDRDRIKGRDKDKKKKKHKRRSKSRSRSRSKSRHSLPSAYRRARRSRSRSRSSGRRNRRGTSSDRKREERDRERHHPSSSSSMRSRDGSQEKDKAVSSSIISSVQSKITQDLMAKVRAMLATSKTFQAPNS